MKLDMHTHTMFSKDNAMRPEDLINMAIKRGLDGVVVTEHLSYDASKPLENLSIPSDFVLLRGMEYHTDSGHLLVYGITEDIFKKPYMPIHDVLDEINARGGVAVPSHPYHKGYTYELCDKVFDIGGKVPAIETVNGAKSVSDNKLAEAARIKLGIGGTGGSDAHFPAQVGLAFTEFESDIRTTEDLVRELKQGKYAARYHEVHSHAR